MAALKRIRETGVTRKIVGVTMDGDPFPELNNIKWPVSSEGSVVGKVTSAIYSPRLKANIGFAWVPTELASLDTTLTVASEWGERGATVVDMPFVDPNKQIPVS
jgi:aminomethyltransferase